MSIGIIDYIILGIYFASLITVGVISSKNLKGRTGHFLAGRNSSWFLVGTSMLITTVSSEHVIGYAESGYSAGFSSAIFAWGGALMMIPLAWYFIPKILHLNLFTMPEYFEKRFDTKSRLFISGLSIAVYIITKISITLYAGSLLLGQLIGWNRYDCSLVLVILTGLLTVSGGLRGILYTHVFHAAMFFLGAILVLVVCLWSVGGPGNLIHQIPGDYANVLKSNSDPDYPWFAILLGLPVLELWYWATDQFIMQRVLSAKDVANARRGALFAGFLLFLIPFLLITPGLVAYVKFGEEAVSGQTYLNVVTQILPPGIKAFAVIALLSALMSSLAAMFNSTATLYSFDIYLKKHPNAGDFTLISIGKIATIVLVVLGIVWVSFMGFFSGNLIEHLQAVQSYIAPPFAATFLVGILWKRATAISCFITMLAGFVIGSLRIILDFFQDSVPSGSFLKNILELHYLYGAFLMFSFYVLLMISVSLIDKKGMAQVKILPATVLSNDVEKSWDLILSYILVGLILASVVILNCL